MNIFSEPISPLTHPFVLTSANTQTTSMHAPSVRPCVPILPRTQTSILPPSSCTPVIHSNKHFNNTVSTVPGSRTIIVHTPIYFMFGLRYEPFDFVMTPGILSKTFP